MAMDHFCLDSGNIVSSGSITAKHSDYKDLFASQFYCTNPSFGYVEFDERRTSIGTIDNLSLNNTTFTTLNDISATTFSYIANLSSHSQT